MFKQLKSIRFQMIRKELKVIYFSLFILALCLFFLYSVYQPIWLSLQAIFLSLGLLVLIMTPVGIYLTLQSTNNIKKRLDVYSVFLSTLSEGKYEAELLNLEENDELDLIGNELNGLAKKLKDQVRSLQKLADEKTDLANQAHVAATIEERQRLARDLHDAVSQQLFALTMMSQATVKTIEKKPEEAIEQVREISEIALQAQNEMRALLLHLRPIQLSGESLEEGIKKLTNELKQKSNLQFDVNIDELPELSQAKEDHLFRLLQEALSNALRHANATKITVNIKEKSDAIHIHISDNGIGFNLEEQYQSKTSYGLKTMRERSEEIGGTFRIRSKEGQGTYIDVRIPK